jgi:acyl-coenzyme A synthetase/AMP-(fatty) acid ligase
VHVTARRVRTGDLSETRSLIGAPLSDLTLLVCDEFGEEVGAGTVGELLVCGPGLALGYLRQPAQTAERFITISHSIFGTIRAYRSGDLVRSVNDTDFEYLGRIDKQVKIRGFRIELGEIEAAIASFPGMRDVVAAVRQVRSNENSKPEADGNGELSIVAYIVSDRETYDLGLLYRHLRARLPTYMMPARVVVIDKLPVNHNGKIDMDALPDPKNPSSTPTSRVFRVSLKMSTHTRSRSVSASICDVLN